MSPLQHIWSQVDLETKVFSGKGTEREDRLIMANHNNLQTASGLRPGHCFIVRIGLLVALIFSAASFTSIVGQTNVLQGTVGVSSASGLSERLPGASLSLACNACAKAPVSTVTNEQGEYKFTGLVDGLYTLQITLSGFKPHTQVVTIHPGVNTLDNIDLEIESLQNEVTVVSEGEGVNTSDVTQATSFKQERLETLPLVNERFQDAIPLVPGVVRGPDGLLNLKGARSAQSGYLVNSANVTDPVTGESAINLPIEAVQTAEVLTNPYAAEYGQFTGGITSVQTRSGTEKFHANATSFFPRPRRRGGSFVGIEAFTPRVTFSGPINKDKLTFFQSFEYRFVRTPVESLPALSRDTDLESLDSLTQVDWEINARNHLTTTFSLFPEKLRYVGLNTFNPQSVTPNFKQRGFLWSVNDRRIMSAKSMLETSFSIKQFDADVFPSSGIAPMNLEPDVNSGSFFNQQKRKTTRYQTLGTYSFSPPNFAGSHFMKLGGGLSYVTYDGSNISQSVRILRADGTRTAQLDFDGGGKLGRNRKQGFAYFQDKWTVNRRLTLDYGVRLDRDDVASQTDFAPRIGFAFLPVLDGRTVIRGGIGIFYDDIDLNVATFSQLQERVLTQFGPDGLQIIGQPVRQRFVYTGAKFQTPRSVNWNIELDREWVKNLVVRVGYQQRQATREFVLNPLDTRDQGNILALSNSGSSRYRELQITTKYRFRERDEFVASYVRSSARGDLNDFNSYYSNFENPIIQANERSRLPFDAPNRFLFYGTFHLKYGMTVVPVFDVRNGFPYSIIDEQRNFVGQRNLAGRYPNFASFDLQVTRSVSLPGPLKKYRAELGLKVFNLTNHFNPRDFQNNIDSVAFGGFYNGVGRKYGTRITFVKK